MYKYALFIILISVMLSACQPEKPPEPTSGIPAETTFPTAEAAVKKDISEYEDCTAVIPNSTKNLVENPIFIFSLIPDADSNLHTSFEELCRNSTGIVRGSVIDRTYQLEDADGTIWYSFAVSEVLYGEEIKPETIITVSCEQGLHRSNHTGKFPLPPILNLRGKKLTERIL